MAPAPVAVGESLAADPFTSLAVHYGMLLGVSDFQAMLANPRGKLRMHQAWQHGPGVVWGLEVSVPDNTTELRVAPGLAVDGVGREVSLGVDYCVDVQQWLAEHEDDAHPVVNADATTFNAQLILRHAACLTRPVPAISSACDGGSTDTAWSRILETAELELRPYLDTAKPDDERSAAFPALRALVRDGVVPTATGEPAPATWLDALRSVLAAETRKVGPPAYTGGNETSTRLFPVDVPGEIVLADLPGLRLETAGGVTTLVAPTIDHAVRRSHVSTWLLEELLGELLDSMHGSLATAGGPTVTKVDVAGTTATVTLSGPLVGSTVAPATTLSSFDSSQADPVWQAVDLTGQVTYADPGTITVTLPAAPTATLTYRLVLAGAGPTPMVALVDGRPVPLAGGRDLAFPIA